MKQFFLLSSAAHREGDLICKLFTEELGMVSVYLRAEQIKTTPYSSYFIEKKEGVDHYCLPLFEAHLWRGKGELWRIERLRLLKYTQEDFSELLTVAKWLYQILADEQPAPLLYKLTKDLCKRLQLTPKQDHQKLLACYLLKLMRHEGVFSDRLICDICHQEHYPCYLSLKGLFCAKHRSYPCLTIDEEVWLQLKLLALSRNAEHIALVDMNGEKLVELVERLAFLRFALLSHPSL